MKLSISRAGSAVMVGALALALAACGSDNTTDTPAGGDTSAAASDAPSIAPVSGNFAGGGSSAQQKAIDAWIAGFQTANPDSTISYDPSGSGAGRDKFMAGGLAWAGSDAYMKDEEIANSKTTCGADGAIDIPVYISPIAIAYNLEGVKDLNISAENIAKIYTGAITKWNDPALAADNPGVTLPDTAITPVHRSDKSGTTNNFTDWVNTLAGDVWTNPANDAWPLPNGDSAQGTSGVADVVSKTPGAVAYLDESGVPSTLNIAKINVGTGWEAPSADGAAAVASASPLVSGRSANDVSVKIDRKAANKGDYPLMLVSYMIVCQTYTDATKGDFPSSWLNYVTSDAAQQAGSSAAGSAPLSGELASKAAAAAASIKVG